MTGFQAYCLYLPVKLHFSTNYDIVKYQGKIKSLDKSFEQKNDKSYYHKLAKLYNQADLMDLCVSNMYENADLWVGDLLSDKSKHIYLQYKSVTESISYHFKQDIDFLSSQEETLKELFLPTGSYPKIINHLFWGNIKPQTVCILNNYLKFIPRIDKALDHDIVWETTSKRLKKLSPFIVFDEVKIKGIINEFIGTKRTI